MVVLTTFTFGPRSKCIYNAKLGGVLRIDKDGVHFLHNARKDSNPSLGKQSQTTQSAADNLRTVPSTDQWGTDLRGLISTLDKGRKALFDEALVDDIPFFASPGEKPPKAGSECVIVSRWLKAALDRLPEPDKVDQIERMLLTSHSLRDGAASTYHFLAGDSQLIRIRWWCNWDPNAKKPTPDRVYIKNAHWEQQGETEDARFFYGHLAFSR